MRKKGLKRRRIPESLEDVRDEVRRTLARQKPGSGDDPAQFSDDIDALLSALSEFRPAWTASPHVHRVALLETGIGIVPFEDDVALPDVKHEYEQVLEMLVHIRAQKGLPPVGMAVFIYPDEIELALQPVDPVRPADVLAGLPDKEISPISKRRRRRLLRRPDMTETRRAVLDRDDWECRKCGAPKDLELCRVEETLDVHDCEAYVALCRSCMPPQSRRIIHRGHELTPDELRGIRSQLALVFQRGSIERIGFVLGKEYFVLKA